jgi:hypothetical protein
MAGHCGGVGPFEMKGETSKTQPSEKNKDDDGSPGPTCTLSGNCSGRRVLRREQLESNHRENRIMGKEGEAEHISHKHSPRKRRNDGTP